MRTAGRRMRTAGRDQEGGVITATDLGHLRDLARTLSDEHPHVATGLVLSLVVRVWHALGASGLDPQTRLDLVAAAVRNRLASEAPPPRVAAQRAPRRGGGREERSR